MTQFRRMRRWTGWAALLGAAAVAAAQLAPGNGNVTVASASQLAASVAVTKDGLATAPVATGKGLAALMVRREQSGVVEVHTELNDMLVVEGGAATLVVGGRVDGATRTAPTEWRGGQINGGRSYALHQGDAIWIPAGMPHQLLLTPHSSFDYLAFKVSGAPASPPS